MVVSRRSLSAPRQRERQIDRAWANRRRSASAVGALLTSALTGLVLTAGLPAVALNPPTPDSRAPRSPSDPRSETGAVEAGPSVATPWGVQTNDVGFGWSVDVDGDTAIVGAFEDITPAGFRAGSAYVYVRSGSTWRPQAKLTPSDAAASQRFGWSVAIDGDTAIVGTIDDEAYTGAVYVFFRSAGIWSEQAKLVGPDSVGGDQFGHSVAIDGDSLLVGALRDDSDEGDPDSGSAYIFVRSGALWTFQAKLVAPDPGRYDFFGRSVAIDADTAVVGADADTRPVGRTGSAYVYVRSGEAWTAQAKLVPPDPGPAEVGSYFGESVDLSGDTVLVGMEGDDEAFEPDLGSAYLFVRSGTTWRRVARLTAPDGAEYDHFGNAVALDGETAVVAAYARGPGALYVFVRQGTGWALQAELVPPNPDPAELLGSSVALRGDTIVAGSSDDTTAAGIHSGSAYVFVRTGTVWDMQAKVIPPDLAAGDAFGISVAVDGDTTAVGAGWDNLGRRFDAGSAYAFVRSGENWALQDRLVAPSARQGDHFGRSIALSGDTIVVGAPGTDPPAGAEAGSAYVFVRSGTDWEWQTTLSAPTPSAEDGFGYSVAVDGDTVVVGAYRDDTGGTDSGSAYVFVRAGTTWTLQAELTAPGGRPYDQFGDSVAIEGDTALIGATRADPLGVPGAGAAYVFVRTGTQWAPQAQLVVADPAPEDAFGGSVAVDGDTALVGAASRDTMAGEDTGSSYVFVRSDTAGVSRPS